MTGLDDTRGELTRVSRLYAQLASDYRAVVHRAALATAGHKRARARRIVELKARGEARSHADAECQAEADDAVADLYQERLVAEAEAEAHLEKLRELREQQANARAALSDDRAIDRMHAYGQTGAA